MSRIPYYKLLLMNIEGRFEEDRREFMSSAEALNKLKELTGQDFANDIEKWKLWLKNNNENLTYADAVRNARNKDSAANESKDPK